MYNVVIPIKSFFDKDQNHYYIYILLNSYIMIQFDVSEGIDINKTSESKACNICQYWYLLDKGFKFQPYVCNGCMEHLWC